MKLLFNRIDIFSVVEHRKQDFKKAFQAVRNEVFEDPIALAARMVEDFSLQVPVLDEQKKYAQTKETRVDVSRDSRRFIRDRSQPFYIDGTEVRIIVPFQGDRSLFEVQPTMFTLNPPQAEIRESELHLIYELTEAGFDVEGAANRTIATVNQYLGSLRGSAEQLKTELQQTFNLMLEQRKRDQATRSRIVADLKIPVIEHSAIQPVKENTNPVRSAPEAGAASQVEWDVFISHASEDKDAIALPLAEALQARGLRVWYDDFSLHLGDSLRESIDRGLALSRFGVVILSGHFFGKHWPQQELNGLATREAGGKKVILPIWHGVGFAEVQGYSVTLADRKAVQTKEGLSKVIQAIIDVVGGHNR